MPRVSHHTGNHGNQHPGNQRPDNHSNQRPGNLGNQRPGNHGNRNPGTKVLPPQMSTPDLPERIGPVNRAPGLVHHSGLTTHSLLSDIGDQGDLDLLGARQAINDNIYIHFLVTVRL